MRMRWRNASDIQNKHYHLYCPHYYAIADFDTIDPETQKDIIIIPVAQEIPEAFRKQIKPFIIFNIETIAATAISSLALLILYITNQCTNQRTC